MGLSALTPLGVFTDCNPGGTGMPPYNAAIPATNAKTDYAINAGREFYPDPQAGGYPPNAGPPLATNCASASGGYPDCPGMANDLKAISDNWNGISTKLTGAKYGQITDGTSKTALVGEKALQPRFYHTGYGDGPPGGNYCKGNGGDNNSMYQGFDYDNGRTIGAKPEMDSDEMGNAHERFGSAHSSGMNLAMCDGSVQWISYEINQDVWGTYGPRDDGQNEFKPPPPPSP
jgi:prepilin-type processing-associated H-X9-DG protein